MQIFRVMLKTKAYTTGNKKILADNWKELLEKEKQSQVPKMGCQ
jgi:hypothetical protein